jgi:hypothetical protein
LARAEANLTCPSASVATTSKFDFHLLLDCQHRLIESEMQRIGPFLRIHASRCTRAASPARLHCAY